MVPGEWRRETGFRCGADRYYNSQARNDQERVFIHFALLDRSEPADGSGSDGEATRRGQFACSPLPVT